MSAYYLTSFAAADLSADKKTLIVSGFISITIILGSDFRRNLRRSDRESFHRGSIPEFQTPVN